MDGHQHVAEVVREAAGHLTEGFEFLRLKELLLQRAALLGFSREIVRRPVPLHYRGMLSLHALRREERQRCEGKGCRSEDATVNEEMPIPRAKHGVHAYSRRDIGIERSDPPVGIHPLDAVKARHRSEGTLARIVSYGG